MSPMAFFTMSKFKTIAWAVFCVGLAVLLAFAHMGIFVLLPLIYAGLFGCIAAYKIVRDHGIISNARIGNKQNPVQLPPPAMTSKGSNRLFVPPPLDRH